MRSNPLIFLFAAAIFYLGAPAVEAGPIPTFNVPATVNASEMIVVGRAGVTRIEDDATGTTLMFSVEVDRVLKGAGGSTPRRIQVRLDLSRPEFGSVSDRRYAIFFLKRAPDGHTYTAANPYYPAAAARPSEAAAAASTIAPLNGVAAELVAALGAAPADLTSGPQADFQSAYYSLAVAIRSLPADLTEEPLRRIASSDRMPGRLWAIECLLMRDDSSPDAAARKAGYIRSIKPLLMNPPADMRVVAFRLASAMEGNVKSPIAVPILADLLRSTDVHVRRSAASTLSDIASRDIIRPLADVALQDDDLDVRYFAVNGLAAVTGHDVPTYAAFKSDENARIRSSRAWAHGAR